MYQKGTLTVLLALVIFAITSTNAGLVSYSSIRGAVPPTRSLVQHSGPVMTGSVKVYFIWYGSWSTSSQQILVNLMSNLVNHPYMNALTSYYDSTGTPASNWIVYGGSTSDNYTQGIHLSDPSVVVSHVLSSKALPSDYLSNSIYFVLSSADVLVDGFGTRFCGSHSNMKYNGADVYYSWVGNPGTTVTACIPQQVSPNGDVGTDAMASVMMHNLVDSITDSIPNSGWYSNADNSEAGESCNFVYGSSKSTSGPMYNQQMGSKNYLLPQILVNSPSTPFCTSAYTVCPPGQYFASSICNACPLNTYNEFQGRADKSSCLPCPFKSSTNNLIGQAFCYSNNNTALPPCPANSVSVVTQIHSSCTCLPGYITAGSGYSIRCLTSNWEQTGVGAPLPYHFYFDRIGGVCGTGKVLNGLSFSRGGCSKDNFYSSGLKDTNLCGSPTDGNEGLTMNTKCFPVIYNPVGSWTVTGVGAPLPYHYYFDRVGGQCPDGQAALGAHFRRGGCSISNVWTDRVVNDNLCGADGTEGLYLDLFCAPTPGLGTPTWRYSGVGSPLPWHYYFDRIGAECLPGEAVLGVKFVRGGCNIGAFWYQHTTDTNRCSSPVDSNEGLTMWLLCAPMSPDVTYINQDGSIHVNGATLSGSVSIGALVGVVVGYTVLVVALVAIVSFLVMRKKQKAGEYTEFQQM